jgi:predicted Ser/Thr protein kinase
MNSKDHMIKDLSQDVKRIFKERQSLLSFDQFMDLVKHKPRLLMRNSAEYVRDSFKHFGELKSAKEIDSKSVEQIDDLPRFKLFDIGTEKRVPIVGGEMVQLDIFRILQAFVRQGIANKVIFLHGPNGSAKSSTIEAIAHGMQKYSETDEGAVYRFNWIFPVDKGATPRAVSGESGPIGFAARYDDGRNRDESYAFLDDNQISSKLQSEFKENPLFLIPMPFRESVLRRFVAEQEGISPDAVELPPHILLSGLSKRNQLIFENLLAAYDGEVEKVYRHIQVERFFYSRQYRIGISTVEPQMSMDATEKQLTMDRNISNLPAVLHNIRFTESIGEIVEANRGILEFSDLLKRPLEAFKYLLTTVERATLGLPSATQNLDVVFFATANEKHLDAFKTLPDFSSFRGRFELVTVPYLLKVSEETKIYQKDVAAISKSKKIAPHAVEALCLWAVLTRLKHPDPEMYPNELRGVINRLEPFAKAMLYDHRPLGEAYVAADQILLKQIRSLILGESVGNVIYEGRFGASPREVRALLYRVAEESSNKTVTPMAIFSELERLLKDRSVYDFLQFESRNKYHDAAYFIRNVRDWFANTFEDEVLGAMNLVEEGQYDQLLARYVEHAVAFVKKEKIFNRKTEGSESPSEMLMKDVETILGVASGDPGRFRESLLARIAGYKIDNPKAKIDYSVIFFDHLQMIKDHYYQEKSRLIEANLKAVLALGTDNQRQFSEKQLVAARSTLAELESRYGYDETSARECVKFLMMAKESGSSSAK